MGQAKALNWTAIAALAAVAVASGSGAAWLYFSSLPQAPAQRADAPPAAGAAPAPTVPQPQAAAPARTAAAPAQPAQQHAATPQASAPAPSGPPRPRFDVVRVGLRGTAVVAGRAAPGAEVILYSDGQQELGRSRADARGEWVILPAEALPAGSRELSLRARLNGEELEGADTVVILVPEAPAGPAIASAPGVPPRPTAPQPAGSGTLAVLMPTPGSGAAPRVLQAPAEASLPRPGQPARLALSTVDYGDTGDLRFAGTAPPNATVRVYLGDRHAGDATSDETGRWTLTPARPPAPGRMTLRVDQIATGGGVAARIEQPIENSPPAEGVPHDGRLVVQPGNNLWRIARQAYGQGTRYTVIFAANREQIRDPNRIYPGQVFALPDNAPPTRSN